jgi:pyruvate formate lyase activating enzyme
MVIGGWQKNSFIDYPEKISCVLFLQGCNFACPYCFNPDLVKKHPKKIIELDHVYDFLEKRKGLLDGVVISGGEPTLHKGLFSLCERIHEMGFSIKLDTNGSRPHVIKKLIRKGMIDYIAMDIKTDPAKYPPIIQENNHPEHILSSIRIIMASSLDYEFRTTCIKPLIDDNIMERISIQIKGAMRYALQQFQPAKVLHPAFFMETDRRFADAELFQLRDIAKRWVKECIVR